MNQIVSYIFFCDSQKNSPETIHFESKMNNCPANSDSV